ncbi:FadR family transcriptional regulator [Vibrio sp. S9_S30]|uniref:FadR/GntR family transcriptional regulator n=1 Tax=Vibrio sp. S9_S30 TaxID=2720226 RepID=UPI001680E836|nr:FadR/GntR family transcriptional regulator [Vibrio sp. S9_S30]MBD1556642.1 FadR family transcriptional regulator [Vibrio sp. S9_S30]
MSEDLSPLYKLLHLIENEGYSPGDKLPTERELAAMFGSSRVSVRAALNRLDALQMIELKARSGIYIHSDPMQCSLDVLALMEEADLPLNKKRIEHAVELRKMLEIQAVRLACQRRTAKDLARIHAELSEGQKALIEGRNLASHDPRFHLALIAAAHNPLLTHLAASFYRMSQRRREVFFSDKETNIKSHRQHSRLYEAIEDQNEEMAVELLEEHLADVGLYFDAWHASQGED